MERRSGDVGQEEVGPGRADCLKSSGEDGDTVLTAAHPGNKYIPRRVGHPQSDWSFTLGCGRRLRYDSRTAIRSRTASLWAVPP